MFYNKEVTTICKNNISGITLRIKLKFAIYMGYWPGVRLTGLDICQNLLGVCVLMDRNGAGGP